MEAVSEQIRSRITNANFPKDEEGRVFHLAVKKGDVANRIVSVGDPRRAKLLASFLDDTKDSLVVTSNRGFVIHTGTRRNVPVSIIATGMGFPMMDFVVRECRAVVDGPMFIIRLGTCGTPRPEISVGSLIVASKGCTFIRRNPDAFTQEINQMQHESTCNSYKSSPFYSFSKIIYPDSEMSQLVFSHLKKNLRNGMAIEGMGATGDSFYSSQGRVDQNFDDHNTTLIDDLISVYPNIAAIEMESFHLLDLARCSKGTIKATAATIVLAQRRSNEFLEERILHELEKEAGISVLDAIIEIR